MFGVFSPISSNKTEMRSLYRIHLGNGIKYAQEKHVFCFENYYFASDKYKKPENCIYSHSFFHMGREEPRPKQ